MKIITILLLYSFVVFQSDGAKILAIFPVPARSHYILGNALLRGLAEKGHDVTMISPFEEKNPPKNGSYRDIILTGMKEENEKQRKEMKPFEMESTNVFLMTPFITSMLLEMTEYTLNHTNVQELLKSKEKFDVVIVEEFLNAAHKGFANHFGAPLILFSTIGANSWVNGYVGNPSPPSYIPETLLSYSSNMTFCERSINLLFGISNSFISYFYATPRQKALYEKHFPNNPPFNEVVYNSSIALLNSHISINQAVPLVPNMIEIGGFHVKPTKKLPDDLQKYLDNSKNGVIYFSMGSNLHSSEMPIDKREAFLKTFAKLNYDVLWKWEEESLPGQPKNVKLGKWLPQQEILAHPNVKLFITHGGLLSTTESVYHGVPVLAIPILGDQKLNAQRIVNIGFGRKLNFREISEELLTENLQELLNNPKYAVTAKLRSQLFHDRLIKPMDTATYWIEYVIRHNGAPHLKVAGTNLSFFKYMLLDVISFLLIISLVSLVVIYKLLQKIFKKRGQKVKQKKS